MSNDAEEKSSRVPLTVIPSTNSVFTTGPSEPGILLAAAPDPAPAVEPRKTVEYEVGMFLGLRDPQRASDDPIVRNALAEAAVLHARILCDLFIIEPVKQIKDDISLQTLFPGQDIKAQYPKLYDLTNCLQTIWNKPRVPGQKSAEPGSHRYRFNKL